MIQQHAAFFRSRCNQPPPGPSACCYGDCWNFWFSLNSKSPLANPPPQLLLPRLHPARPALMPVPCAAPTMAQSHLSRRSQLQSLRSQALVELSNCCCLRSLPRLGEVVDQLLFERQVAQLPLPFNAEILEVLPF